MNRPNPANLRTVIPDPGLPDSCLRIDSIWIIAFRIAVLSVYWSSLRT